MFWDITQRVFGRKLNSAAAKKTEKKYYSLIIRTFSTSIQGETSCPICRSLLATMLTLFKTSKMLPASMTLFCGCDTITGRSAQHAGVRIEIVSMYQPTCEPVAAPFLSVPQRQRN